MASSHQPQIMIFGNTKDTVTFRAICPAILHTIYGKIMTNGHLFYATILLPNKNGSIEIAHDNLKELFMMMIKCYCDQSCYENASIDDFEISWHISDSVMTPKFIAFFQSQFGKNDQVSE